MVTNTEMCLQERGWIENQYSSDYNYSLYVNKPFDSTIQYNTIICYIGLLEQKSTVYDFESAYFILVSRADISLGGGNVWKLFKEKL